MSAPSLFVFDFPLYMIVDTDVYEVQGLPNGCVLDAVTALGMIHFHVFSDEHNGEEYIEDDGRPRRSLIEIPDHRALLSILHDVLDAGATHVGFDCPSPRSKRTRNGGRIPIRDAIAQFERSAPP